MAIIKCKMCGGDLELTADMTVAECEYCGTKQTVPTADNDKKLTLFARANRLRAACEFDKAAGIYESIVADFPEEAEAYWGLVLCQYGIEYVDDPATGKKIPTCHRSSFENLMDDGNFELVMEYSESIARRVYRDEAKTIEEIRKGIIEVSGREEPYDIFICYKETDFDGNRTLDSVLAQDIYDALTEKGYRVFFSRISLEDKLGMEYEPYIFAALNSAKVMLAVGTDYEYYNAVWVKNEWSRFLKLIAAGQKKTLIPCFKGIDAYDMPKEFARLQAQDLGKVGAIQDLLRGVEKIIPRETPKEVVVVQQSAVIDTAPLLKRAFMFLEDGEWSSAEEYCEKVLDKAPECAEAYLGKLMAELHVSKREELRNQKEPFDANNNYKKVLRFSDENLRIEMEGYIAFISNRNKEDRIAREKQVEEERIAREKRAEEERIARKKQAEENRIAREKQAEKERIAREKRTARLLPIRKKLMNVQNLIAAGSGHTVGLKSDGTVMAIGDNKYGQCNVSNWTDIMAISAGITHTVGLKADGTVVALGENKDLQCKVDGLKNIVSVSAGGWHTVCLQSDGAVVAVGSDNFGQCKVDNWSNIVAVSTGRTHTVGLKSDGTVVAVGSNGISQCNVACWTDIVAISAGSTHTVGLKSDGTVVAVGDNSDGQCKVSSWIDVVAISAGDAHTVGLKSNGTVVAVGDNSDGQCKVSSWTDVVAISADSDCTVGLKADGTVAAVGDNSFGQCNVGNWRLFNNIDTLEAEKEAAKAAALKRRERRIKGLCQHCGGELKGLLSKKCVSCGKAKDY